MLWLIMCDNQRLNNIRVCTADLGYNRLDMNVRLLNQGYSKARISEC